MNRVLIIEDNLQDAFLIQTHLNRCKFLTSVSVNLFDILKKVENKLVDILTIDLQMPELDGQYLIEHVRKVDQTIPIVVITAMATEESRIACLQKGANYYITKPFSKADFERVFKNIKNPN